MRRHIHNARDLIIPVVDFFYPPFRRLMNLQTFRYAACGGLNTFTGLVVFYISFKFVLKARMVDLGFYVFEAYSIALFLSFLISFPFGFFLMKYVVFPESRLKGRVQMFRYLLAYLISLVINYLMLRLLVEVLHIYPTIAQVITTVIIIVFSYLFQRYFTFKATPAEEISVKD
jgi:putative flippase GtrA